MTIGLCDDDPKIRKMVRDWLNKSHPEVNPSNIVEFCSGEALIEHVRLKPLDLVFLDCCMSGKDGIDTAASIRKTNSNLMIIMLTDYSQYAVFGYDVDVSSFVTKGDFFNKIEHAYKKAVKKINLNESKTFFIKTKSSGRVNIELNDSLYIESIRRIKHITLIDGVSYDFYATMSELESKLAKFGFLRTHKSYLVNCKNIVRFHGQNIEMLNGDFVPLTDKWRDSVLKSFTFFMAG